jgi:hypothetical protein
MHVSDKSPGRKTMSFVTGFLPPKQQCQTQVPFDRRV